MYQEYSQAYKEAISKKNSVQLMGLLFDKHNEISDIIKELMDRKIAVFSEIPMRLDFTALKIIEEYLATGDFLEMVRCLKNRKKEWYTAKNIKLMKLKK